MAVRLPETRSAGQPAPPGTRPRPRSHGAALFVVCALTTAAGCAGGAPEPSTVPRPSPIRPGAPLPDEAREWVDETLASLDLRQRAAQLVMVWMSGGYAPVTDAEQTRVAELVDEGLGGIVISVGTPLDYASRLGRLQERAAVPLLVGADFESGPGYRLGGITALPSGVDLGGATVLPPAMAFGAIDDETAAREAGWLTALEARALGVHVNFAPVLDVNNNPDNPIINTRAYGEDPERVAALGAAYIRGAHEGGLLTTAKHFPGHGDTGTDSHVALPVIPGDRARLDRLELVPFRRAIEAGVDAVMTAHVAAPGILGEGAPPATLSPYFMTRLLREELGFDGLLFTDALDMGAIVEAYGPADAAVRALEAGADVLLMPAEPRAAIDAVVDAVAEGRLSGARIERSVRRILEMKTRAGLHRARGVDPEAVTRTVGTAAHLAFADSMARRSLTLVRDLPGAVPFDTTRVRRVLSLTFSRDGDLTAGRIFDARLADHLEVVRARTGFDTDPARYDTLAARLDSIDAVIVSAYVAPRSGAGSVEPTSELSRFFAAVELADRPAVLVSFGSPYLLSAIPDPPSYLLAWSGAPGAQRAAADALLGRSPISGKLPVSLPPLYARGDGLTRPAGPAEADVEETGPAPAEVPPEEVGMDSAALARVDRLLEAAVGDSTTPGAAIAVGRHGRLVRLRGFGTLDWSPGSPAVTDSTLYDLASLTKVIGTTTAVMLLVEAGRIVLDTPVGDVLPEWSEGWKAEVTIRDLLLHRGGLPPFRPYWRELSGREAYRAAIADAEAAYRPRSRTVYSDLGFITLGLVVERATGIGLDAFLDTRVFAPLGMRDTGFLPSAVLADRIAPTEIDTVFRHRLVHGEVHDENAFALGGVAGHAGLFSSARDLARFGGWVLDAARAGRGLETASGGPEGLPAPATVDSFTRRAAGASSRALGWDTPGARSSSGRFFSQDAFGHTGFTGTSVWVDPERDVFVVLLTNRVHPTRDNRRHIPLRRAVHDGVAAAITDIPVAPREGGGEGGG